MRSVEMMSCRALLLCALVAGMAGCASVKEAAQSAQQAVAAGVAPVVPTASAVAAPIDAATQRAFDDALRLMRAGRNDEAERALRALAQTRAELGGVHANLGLIYRQAGKATESVAAFEQAVRVSPEQAVFHNQLGIAYRQQGQFKPAQVAYERAIALDASYAAAQLNLAILHDMYLGDSARALELYERYLALPTQKDAAVTKWVAELKNRKPEQQLASKKVPS